MIDHVGPNVTDYAGSKAFSTRPPSPPAVPTTGLPGVREQCHPTYYGAFVHDPDGHDVEAVCHRPG